jgi:hypothetical protein
MAGNGGKREGAGRKAGVPNKATIARQEAVAATGETPLDHMLRVMRDPTNDHARRDEMARAAAPYVHPKLAAIEHTGKDGGAVALDVAVTPTDIARKVAFLLTSGLKQEDK